MVDSKQYLVAFTAGRGIQSNWTAISTAFLQAVKEATGVMPALLAIAGTRDALVVSVRSAVAIGVRVDFLQRFLYRSFAYSEGDT